MDLDAQVIPAHVAKAINEATRRVVDAAHPDRIILFGSYARGDFGANSDVDMLVILPAADNLFDEMVRLSRLVADLPAPIEVVVFSRGDVEQRRHLRGTLLYHALLEGRVLYDAA